MSRCNSSHDPQKPAHLTTGDRLILDEEHLKHVIIYVHLNPVAAGLVGDPFDYPTSGHREVMGLLPPCLCDVEKVAEVLDKGAGSVSRWVAEGLELQLTERTFRSKLDQLARLYGLDRDPPAGCRGNEDAQSTSTSQRWDTWHRRRLASALRRRDLLATLAEHDPDRGVRKRARELLEQQDAEHTDGARGAQGDLFG